MARKKSGYGAGIYAQTRALGDTIGDQLRAMFPDELANGLARAAAASLAEVARDGMKKELKKHVLTGETIAAMELEEYEIPNTNDAKSVYLVGIPRDGNVRDEHYKGSRRRRRYPNGLKVSGELGDGPFYKGIYLQYGHGSLKPINWVGKGVKAAKKKVTPEVLQAWHDVWEANNKKHL